MRTYGNISNRVIGKVFDSVAPPSMSVDAVPFALFPKNNLLQSFARAILKINFNLNKSLRKHYDDGVYNMFYPMATSPALIFVSKKDPFASLNFAIKIADTWKASGVDVKLKVFEDSEHVKHFQKHPEDYLKNLKDFWNHSKLFDY